MKFLTLLSCMIVSLTALQADDVQEPSSPSEEIASGETEVPVDENCGCGKKKNGK